MEERKDYICIHCEEPVQCLYKCTDMNFTKLIHCSKCKKVVDPYVECERNIILMDVIMQEISAFRHILYNASNFTGQFYIKLAVSMILSEGYLKWNYMAGQFYISSEIKNNESYFYLMCICAIFELFMFVLIIQIFSNFLHPTSLTRIIQATLLGQCGRLTNIASIIWNQTSSLPFQVFVAIFIFTTTIQSLRAVLKTSRLVSTLMTLSSFIISMSCTWIVQHLVVKYTCNEMHNDFQFTIVR